MIKSIIVAAALSVAVLMTLTPAHTQDRSPLVSPVTMLSSQIEGETTRRPALTDLKFAQSHKYQTCRIQCNKQEKRCHEWKNYETCKAEYARCLSGC